MHCVFIRHLFFYIQHWMHAEATHYTAVQGWFFLIFNFSITFHRILLSTTRKSTFWWLEIPKNYKYFLDFKLPWQPYCVHSHEHIAAKAALVSWLMMIIVVVYDIDCQTSEGMIEFFEISYINIREKYRRSRFFWTFTQLSSRFLSHLVYNFKEFPIVSSVWILFFYQQQQDTRTRFA